MKYIGILLEYPAVGNEYLDTHIITEVFYYSTKKQWYVKSDHATLVKGYDLNYSASESEDVVDIAIFRGRDNSNPGLGNHIAAYNNKIYCHEISMEDITTIFDTPKVVGGYM